MEEPEFPRCATCGALLTIEEEVLGICEDCIEADFDLAGGY